MSSHLDLVEMGLMSNPAPTTVQAQIDELDAHRRAVDAIKAETEEMTGPLWREDLEKKIVNDVEGVSREIAWFAVGDLLVDGVLSVYDDGTDNGDIIRAR